MSLYFLLGAGLTLFGLVVERLLTRTRVRNAYHLPGCLKCGVPGCGGTYRCPKCRRTVGWCFGCADDRPELCDDCWCLAHQAIGDLDA
jgi:hypothetical protein